MKCSYISGGIRAERRAVHLRKLRSPTEESEAGSAGGGSQAAKRRKEAKQQETAEQAFERIGAMKLSYKERGLFSAAKSAFFNGEIGRKSDGKWTKGEVFAMGREITQERHEAERGKRIAELSESKPDNYHIITDDADLPGMMQRIDEELSRQQSDPWFRKVLRYFNETDIRKKLAEQGIDIPFAQSLTVWDTETSGVDTMIDLSGGYSFWLPLLDEGYYVAYGHLTGEAQCTRSKALDIIRAFVEEAAHIKSFHNAEYDISIFRNDGLQPAGVRFNSQDAMQILNDHEESYGLKPLFTKYKRHISEEAAEMDDWTFEDLFGNTTPMLYPIEPAGIYAIKDVHKGWLLTKWQIDILIAKDGLATTYFEIRQYLPEVNTEIARTGFEIDLPELEKLREEYQAKLEEERRKLYETYGIDDDFLYEMSRQLKGEKIREWMAKQKERIAKRDEMLAKCRAEVKKANPKTKKYAQLKERIHRYESNPLPKPIPQNAPDYIHEFNLSSGDHLAYLIYDVLGIKDRTKDIAKDKAKRRSTAKEVLERYFEEEESLKPLENVSKYETLLGTFIEKIPKALEQTGRIHTSLKTISTGRYSSSGYSGKPVELAPENVTDENFLDIMRGLAECERKVSKGTNLQNIPARYEDGLRVRKSFIPRKGWAFIGSDLSSIEPRIQAHIMVIEFADHIFADMYRKGLDPYIEFASLMFDVDKELCAEKAYKDGLVSIPYRKLTKDMFLAKGYGQAEGQFVKTAVGRGVDEESAKAAYRKFDEILPGFAEMVSAAFEHLRKHGWTATIYGQKRRFPEYQQNWRRLCTLMRKCGIRDKSDPKLASKSYKLSPDDRTEFWDMIRKTGRDERAAFNHRIQGSGANILQLCMIRSYYELTLGRGWEFNLTLHDEQKSSAPLDEITPEAVELYDDIMTNTVSLEVPLKSDTVIEPRWMEEYDPDEWFSQTTE